MSEWVNRKLREVGTLERGRSRHRPRYAFHLYNGPYPFIQTGEVRAASKYINSYENTYSEDGLKQSKLWPKGTLCITIAANIAELAILDFDACFPDSVLGFLPDTTKTSVDFVFYTLRHYQKTLKHIGEGSVQDNINLGTFENIEFPFPPISEQKSIASVLSALDDKINLLHRQNKTLESMAETLFRQWFIEEAQADWEITTLDCHITVAKGLSYKGAGLTTSDNGIPLFSLNSVLEGGGYKSAGIKYYNGDFKERHIIKHGDIIVANTEQGHEYRLIGYPAIIPTTKSKLSIYTHHLFKVSINDDSYLTNYFMYYLLCSKDMHEQVVAATNGSTVNQLSADGLQRPEFKLPPECMVKKFTTQITSFWEKISINNSQIKNIESLRDTLLPKLLSGEVRVKYAEEEIAAMQE
ncbi:restriction endonuclease subunit S [Klebsiella variicola]|jgi:type I restriction enzyme S subunit|uniref:restriction endonuclease subunit S n=1 Tax=Klebsiella variicola TaxID=244366 RepID=UPI000C7DCF71|nr:restriction endonuclease subunit S [Klebsiella variicola]PLK31698.1 hypothetical protein CYD38_25970 [Klebsiella variicola]REI42165.1 restriction endonuclease subunit S [Klebsiella variicola]REI42602.1 restriction endonuclease subunit S [Klebsiella variicola]REI45471.1 restriction endonuclease subunit S [Klebsiella variicola]REI59468.1 restriction endonuclease subunit S [Klebsiella variicola]